MSLSNVSRRRFLSLAGLAASGGLLARTPLLRACPVAEVPSPDETVAAGISAFAADLHSRLARDAKGESLFFSPFSIEAALAMTAAGARGATLDEMLKTLHLTANPHVAFADLIHRLNWTGPYANRCPRPYQLSVANAIWADKGFPWHQEFMDLTRKHYGAGLVEVDFGESEAARKRINDWVETQTHDKIKDLIPSGAITAATRMVLANAIYFKSNWQLKFDKKVTRDAAFTHADGTKADVPMMHLDSEFNYGVLNLGEVEVRGPQLPPDVPRVPIAYIRPEMNVQVLEMPYVGEEFSMLVYLPETHTAANRLVSLLGANQLTRPVLRKQTVRVALPRFKAESKFSLKPALMDLGMKHAFGSADFTGMSPLGKLLQISAVLHKAFVEVNEEGSEAAAATAVIIKQASMVHEEIEFRADRPFVFTIRENTTGTVLFLGRYAGPKA